ncbi:ATP-binding protein [Diaminobutyricimonas sp. TR449]|uniref:ATP-binding protein n=1 Tax=Diaminobutyricimonas sp. TR449 TaxID=2708076 RepID=UPI00141DEC37|nr:ATP-binding protein [Diaminobutyricimonas sp. TR449]
MDDGSDHLAIGTSAGAAAHLQARAFNRHTFWCGQSGSGKTYALGVVLEQLLSATQLPIVVFDPNGDFVRLGEPAPTAGDEAIRDRDIRVLRPDPDGTLRVRFTDMSLASKAAMLRLDPLNDRTEYNSMLRLEQLFSTHSPDELLSALFNSNEGEHRLLAERIENLGAMEWQVWARGKKAVTDVVDERPDATVLDLGGFQFSEEPLVVALAVLEHLWLRREERKPVLLVIEEAHNLSSPDLDTPLGRAVREQLVRIAAEGRKYGLWLLLSTQRPSRVHSSIISQCDNVALMKMTSPADLAQLGSTFGFIPPGLLERSPRFRKGEALFAGGFIEEPAVVQVRQRLTQEGGADVTVPLR